MSIVIKASFQWNGKDNLLTRCGLEKGGRVQLAIDNAVIRYSIPYCPFDTGTLAKSPYAASTPGKVIYPGPYARYQYYGKSKIGKDLEYHKDKNPMAGSFWFERMKADHTNDILREAITVARRK